MSKARAETMASRLASSGERRRRRAGTAFLSIDIDVSYNNVDSGSYPGTPCPGEHQVTARDTTSSPAIHVRNISFGHVAQKRPWLNDDPFASAFFNALSVTFPQGERFFMDSVRRYKAQLPPEL